MTFIKKFSNFETISTFFILQLFLRSSKINQRLNTIIHFHFKKFQNFYYNFFNKFSSFEIPPPILQLYVKSSKIKIHPSFNTQF